MESLSDNTGRVPGEHRSGTLLPRMQRPVHRVNLLQGKSSYKSYLQNFKIALVNLEQCHREERKAKADEKVKVVREAGSTVDPWARVSKR